MWIGRNGHLDGSGSVETGVGELIRDGKAPSFPNNLHLNAPTVSRRCSLSY